MDDDHFHDECGVFGVFGAEEAANLTYLGLHSLQHRGQESTGIVSTDGERMYAHRALGLVQDAFGQDVIERLRGDRAIGHVRYSTAGGGGLKNAQPIAISSQHGSLAVAHNGNLTNFDELRERLEAEGSIFQTTSDTELVVHLMARSKRETSAERVADALGQVEGAYSIVFLTPDELIAVRDPHGFRPLCIGRLHDTYVVASEPPAFHLIGAEFVRDVEPGEVVVIDREGLRSSMPFEPRPKRMCIFEYVYFARPDSTLNGVSVYAARKELGRVLARERPADVDLVIPVPDSGVASAMGFANELGLPFELGLIRSHYVGRTFIEPAQSIRHFGVRLKLSPVRALLEGKRVAVVDDSIVRGTTSRKIVKMLRDAGASEVHLRISSPPTRWPCFYGIDTPSRRELIAARHDVEEIGRYVTADSIGYVSIEGLHRAIKGSAIDGGAIDGGAIDSSASGGSEGHCDACFSGDYPIPVRPREAGRKRQLPLIGV